MNHATIPLKAVELSLMTARLRSHTQGRTALLAAYSPRLAVDLDCHHGTAPSAASVAFAKREGLRTEQAAPIVRGHIVDVIKRICFFNGHTEVRKTFGAGMKELSREHRFFLHAGSKGGTA